MIWARRFADGLLGKARALLHGLGPKGEYPSRIAPCPFCGATPECAWQYGWGETVPGSLILDKPLWAVRHCCAPGHGNSEAEAIASWNRRAA
jgi:hypothetical protein